MDIGPRPTLQAVTAVWLVLSVATIVSWYLGTHPAPTHRPMTAIALVTISMVKVRCVIRYFMEVRSAPRVLGWICDTWVVAVWAVIVGFYEVSST